LDNQSVVNALLPQMQDSNIAQTIVDLSAFTNRYYTSTSGVNASTKLLESNVTQLNIRSPDAEKMK
jgi:leucyl aminopeptidase